MIAHSIFVGSLPQAILDLPHHTLEPRPEEWEITGIHLTVWWVTRDFSTLDEKLPDKLGSI